MPSSAVATRGPHNGTELRLQSRIAELETCLLVTAEAHDRRVSELLLANAREVESRRRANRERDMAQTMLRAIAGALMKAETERDNANRIMREVLAENVQLLADLGGRDTLSLEDGTEGGNG